MNIKTYTTFMNIIGHESEILL